jgi:hypothetical protein
MQKILIFSLAVCFSIISSGILTAAEHAESQPSDSQESSTAQKPRRTPSYTPSTKSESPPNRPTQPLFRTHDPRYYPPKSERTAIFFSATLPGLGQAYAGKPVKGVAFLAAEFGVLAVAIFNIDRAFDYDDLADRFATGFQDPHTENIFLTREQGRVKSRGHARLGAILLAAGIGLHVWNIFDASDTVEQYNSRRFPAQVQQTERGETYLSFTHRF